MRGKQIHVGEIMPVFSTKVTAPTRELIAALTEASKVKQQDEDYSQRRLLEDMLAAYVGQNPDLLISANRSRAAIGKPALLVPGMDVLEGVEVSEPGQLVKKKVKTVQYIGRPQRHLYETGSKNSTGCGLAGTIDPETIVEQDDPDNVDCKKCRYCRKAAFE